jgi:hypothetical protein
MSRRPIFSRFAFVANDRRRSPPLCSKLSRQARGTIALFIEAPRAWRRVAANTDEFNSPFAQCAA